MVVLGGWCISVHWPTSSGMAEKCLPTILWHHQDSTGFAVNGHRGGSGRHQQHWAASTTGHYWAQSTTWHQAAVNNASPHKTLHLLVYWHSWKAISAQLACWSKALSRHRDQVCKAESHINDTKVPSPRWCNPSWPPPRKKSNHAMCTPLNNTVLIAVGRAEAACLNDAG